MGEVVFTTCDVCNPEGETTGLEGRGYVLGDRRSAAADFGWLKRIEYDICPECQDEQGATSEGEPRG
jgi:hypothetical protein